MNTAKRLSDILTKIRASKKNIAFDIFEEVFNVEGCTSVASKLLICDKQINTITEKADVRLISFLKKLFNCKGLTRSLDAEKKSMDQFVMALNMASAYMPEEKIDIDSITELADALEIFRAKVEHLESIEDHDKEVVNSFINEMRGAIDDINIGGIEAFMKHAESASGKLLMYHGSFQKGGVMEDATDIFNKTTDIINSSQTWWAVVGYVGGKFLGS